MGWGTSLTPSSLLPFGGGGQNRQGPTGGIRPNGGVGYEVGAPGGSRPLLAAHRHRLPVRLRLRQLTGPPPPP